MSSGTADTSNVHDWRDYGPSALSRELAAALALFADQGYEGTSIRQIAARAGLSVPGLYHHYSAKQSILVSLLEAVMVDLLGRTRQALDEKLDAPASEQFDAVVECLLRFHMFRRDEAFVASTELRSLTPDNRETYIALRDEQQRMLDDIIVAGAADGSFTTAFPIDASRAVATLCIGVAGWYRPDGVHPPDEIVRRYLSICRNTVGASA